MITILRERQYLASRYAAIFSSVGVLCLICAMVMLVPLTTVLIYPHELVHIWAFMIPSLGLAFLGSVLWLFFHSASRSNLTVQEGGVIVLFGWLMVVVFSSVPFILILHIPFSRAFFESMSGWTTTGLSVIDVTSAGQMILFWRSLTQLCGGAGLAIIMVSAIAGPTELGISSAEGRSEQLVPHVKQSARLVLLIYSGYAIAGTVAYRLAGMSSFDAINHAFAAVSTGGFSTRVESIGYWDSVAVEAVTFPLMLLGNLSFITAWFFLRGKIRTASRNGEIRLLAFVVPISVASLFLLTSQALYPQIGKSFRVALFETVTAITTTGFSTVGYGNWNSFGVFLLIVLMLIGGGTLSTAGGIKQFRIYLMTKFLFWDLKRFFLPKSSIQNRSIFEGQRRVFVDDVRAREVAVFVFLYLSTYALVVLILCANGFNLRDSLFESASALGTVGLSLGVTSATMPDVALWTEIIAMFLGRLEFTVVIVSIVKVVSELGLMAKRREKGYASDKNY